MDVRFIFSTNFSQDYQDYLATSHDISVVGSLEKHVGYWRHIDTPSHLLHIIEEGYTIPLQRIPHRILLDNNRSSMHRPTFVREAIDDLLLKGAVMEVSKPPRVVNPLTVAAKNGKLRLVLDLRHINKHVILQKCKIEGAETLMKYLPGASYLFGFDFKAGYHHIRINPTQWKLLGFSYTDHTECTRYFHFCVLPFGLSSAGFIFTKILRVLIQHWRERQIRILAFFDDGISAAVSLEEALTHSRIVHDEIVLAGFIPNKEKSQWQPLQILSWLGMLYDLLQQKVFATRDKIDKAMLLMQQVLDTQPLPVRMLASLTGTLTSMQGAFGDIVYLKSKHMQIIIAQSDDWSRHVTLSTKAKKEIYFWLNYVQDNNGFPLVFPVASGALSFSDASGVGCAALITPMPHQRELVVHRTFTAYEQAQSSTYRELLAVVQGLRETKHLLQNQCLRWHTDAKNVVSIVRKGSMKPALLDMALEIHSITKEYAICLSVSWLKREENERADAFSRIVDFDDWGVHPIWFAHICKHLGLMTIDRFADKHNTKLRCFNSRFYCKEACATDAFTQDWGHQENWLVPPLYLIIRTLQYMELNKARGILVVPHWRAAHFWPAILNLFKHKS